MHDVPPKRGEAWVFYLPLISKVDTRKFQVAPTLATGDVQLKKDGVLIGNLATLPTVTPVGGTDVKVQLSASEMDANYITVTFIDVAGDEWCDLTISFPTAAAQLGDLAVPGSEMTLTAGERTSIATAVWASASRTLTGFGTLVADLAAAVWAYATRTLTQSAAQVQAVLAGSEITVKRGTRWDIALTGLGSLADRTKLYVTIKADLNDPDSEAILQWEETAGLLRLNGAAATAADGTLTVNDEGAGNITFSLKSAAAATLTPAYGLFYDVKKVVTDGDDAEVVTEQRFNITADITRVVS